MRDLHQYVVSGSILQWRLNRLVSPSCHWTTWCSTNNSAWQETSGACKGSQHSVDAIQFLTDSQRQPVISELLLNGGDTPMLCTWLATFICGLTRVKYRWDKSIIYTIYIYIYIYIFGVQSIFISTYLYRFSCEIRNFREIITDRGFKGILSDRELYNK